MQLLLSALIDRIPKTKYLTIHFPRLNSKFPPVWIKFHNAKMYCTNVQYTKYEYVNDTSHGVRWTLKSGGLGGGIRKKSDS